MGMYLKKTHSLFPVAEMAVNFLKGLQNKDKSVAIKTQRFFAILIKFFVFFWGVGTCKPLPGSHSWGAAF